MNLDRFKIPKFDFRTVWISDIHLGTKDCKAESLLLFIKSVNAQKIYLVVHAYLGYWSGYWD